MSPRRNSNSPGRGDERSDLTDVKALAAKARSESSSRHVVAPNPTELSGVRARRDSVVGMRLTPPPRAGTPSELPNWFWGAVGCLSVLLVGFACLFVLGRSGKLISLFGRMPAAASASAPAPMAAVTAPVPPPSELTPPMPAPSTEIVPIAAPHRERPPTETAARPVHVAVAPSHAAVSRPPVADEGAPSEPGAASAATTAHAEPTVADPSAAAAVPVAAPVPQGDDQTPKAAATRPPVPAPPKGRVAKAGSDIVAHDQGVQGAQGVPDDTPDMPEAKPSPPRAPRPRAAAPKAADDSDDDQSAPGQDDVEAALDKLTAKVRGCFVKYQIKGVARVRLVAMPDGTADGVHVTGDFEGTPTGLCVESLLADAKLPTFKGPPLRLSQSYQLR